MKKVLMAGVLSVAMIGVAQANFVTCNYPLVRRCIAAGGRGGNQSCSCVPAPPPACPVGGYRLSYGDCLTVYAEWYAVSPTTCEEISTYVCCDNGVLTPNVNGFRTCAQY